MILEQNKYQQRINLSVDDISFIKNNYSNLKILNDKIVGNILISRQYNDMIVNEDFNIEILLYKSDISILPKVMITDDKFDVIAKKLNILKDDLHLNSDDSFCLTINLDEKKYFKNEKFNLKEFFEKLLIPYLFWIACYYKYDQKPWGEYSHGIYGVFEYIYDNKLSYDEIKDILIKFKIDIKIFQDFSRQFYCFRQETILEKLLCNDKKYFKGNKKIKFRKYYKKTMQGILKVKKVENV